MDELAIKKLALIISANCLKNTILENDTEKNLIPLEKREQLNKNVSNKIYTFLLYLLTKNSDDYSALIEEMAKLYPENWPAPELDSTFIKYVKQNKQPSAL